MEMTGFAPFFLAILSVVPIHIARLLPFDNSTNTDIVPSELLIIFQ